MHIMRHAVQQNQEVMRPAPVAMRNLVTKPTRVLAQSSYAAPKLSNRTSNKNIKNKLFKAY